MKARQERQFSAVVLTLSVILLLATLILPNFKFPEAATAKVPETTVPPGGYQIYGYGIPPVVQGSSINVTLSGFTPYQVQYSLSPTEGNIVLAPLAFGKVNAGPAYSFSGVATDSYSLELMIVAYNGSGFTISYSGMWSPFDWLLVYTSPAVFMVAASLAATYYFGTRIPAQMNEEKVKEDLRREKGVGKDARLD